MSQAASSSGHGSKQAMSLVDLPSPWLQQLVEGEQEEESLLALLRSCRSMRDLVLSLRDVRLDFTLPIPPDQQAAAQSKLLLACKLSSSVKLQLEQHDVPEAAEANLARASACTLMVDALAAAGQGLAAITNVTLAGLTLSALVPPWLIGTCPHMTSLQLEDCTFSGLPAPGIAIPTCSQLLALDLCVNTCIPNHPTTRAQWHHQLRSLTGLNSLTTHHTETVLCVGSVIGKQLTKLELQTETPSTKQLREIVAHCPLLTELLLDKVFLVDKDLAALLSMQQLTVLRCSGFVLKESHTHHRCRWTELGFIELNVASFDRLPPLDSVRSLVSTDTCYIIPYEDLDATNRVVEAIRRCGGWHVSHSRVHLDLAGVTVSSQSLAATLSLLGSCITESGSKLAILGYAGGPVTAELLATLKQHPASLSLTAITFGECTWAPGVWPLLLPGLPPTITQVWIRDPTITEAHLTIMCALADRPIQLHFWGDGEVWQGVQARVQGAMEAMGHQHVELEFHGED